MTDEHQPKVDLASDGATKRQPMTPERCPDCDRPIATSDDFGSTREGEGGHLCWRVWNADRCLHPSVDWRERAFQAEDRIASLEDSLTQVTSERDIARSRLDMSESYGRDKDARIAALEVGLRTACDLLDEWIECHTALDSCEDEPDWATSTRLRVLADTTKET